MHLRLKVGLVFVPEGHQTLAGGDNPLVSTQKMAGGGVAALPLGCAVWLGLTEPQIPLGGAAYPRPGVAAQPPLRESQEGRKGTAFPHIRAAKPLALDV